MIIIVPPRSYAGLVTDYISSLVASRYLPDSISLAASPAITELNTGSRLTHSEHVVVRSGLLKAGCSSRGSNSPQLHHWNNRAETLS